MIGKLGIHNVVRIDIITIFPEMFKALDVGVIGRLIRRQQLNLHYWNPRDYTEDKNRRIDARPYGGGPGMIMRPEPLLGAIEAARFASTEAAQVIHLSPQGQPLTQLALLNFSKQPRLILLASRYEGIDQRLLTHGIDAEWSIGDYVLSGGELPAMVMIDGIARLLLGALNHPRSTMEDSFYHGLLDHPHYTKPEKFANMGVPELLKGGNHQVIACWRRKQALGQTWLKRPDLLEKHPLNDEDRQLLREFIRAYECGRPTKNETGEQ